MKLFEGGIIAAVLLFMAANQGIAPPKEMPIKEMPDLLESPIPVSGCTVHLPFGNPDVPGNIQAICKLGYISYFDLGKKIPRLVVYRETGAQTLGCLSRLHEFHTERNLPPGSRPFPSDYHHSGYDMGHNAPDQDMADTQIRLYDSYNFINVAPQLPGLNREGWESLEEKVRAWAYERGEVVIYVGSIVSDQPQTIGSDHIAIPDAFYKVVVDPKTGESIGFIMPNQDTPKGDVSPYEVPVAEIEKQANIHLPLPDQTDRNNKPSMWHTDVAKWRLEHKAMCEIGRR